MREPMQSLLVVTKAGDAAAGALGLEITEFLRPRIRSVELCEHEPGAPVCTGGAGAGDVDLVLVLGGDGTFISVARRLHGHPAPLLGLNLGRVGFLAELPRDHWREFLERALSGDFARRRRLCLEYRILREGREVGHGLAVNDLVVGRGILARLVRLELEHGGEHVVSLRADGLILSTPTGAAAYGASAGGPLVHPDLEVLVVTPICPFLNGLKPLVLPPEPELGVRVEDAGGDVHLTEDGQKTVPLAPGDRVLVRRSPSDLVLADLGHTSYFGKLRSKGFLTER